MTALLRKVLSPVVELRENEVSTSVMMFAYSFLVMTAYTTLKPVTRSKFIADLGADNLPLVQFAFGLVVGFVMQAYSTGFRQAAQAVGAADHAGRPGRCPGGLLVLVPDRV